MNRLGVIAALPAEARCLLTEKLPLQTLIQHDDFFLYISGIGAENATSAAQALLAAGVTHLVSWGTAGALSVDAKPGTLLIPKTVSCSNQTSIETDTVWCESLLSLLPDKLTVMQGTLHQSSKVISSVTDKAALFSQYKAVAIDMESYAVASFSVKNKIPFIVVRSIVDANNETIPSVALESVDEFGRCQPLKLLAKLTCNITQLPKLIRLGQHFNLARQTLIEVRHASGKSLALK